MAVRFFTRSPGGRPPARKEKLERRVIAVALLLAGAALLFHLAFHCGRKAVDLYEVPGDELEGRLVTVEVPWIYACYAYTGLTSSAPEGLAAEKWYLIDANGLDYCGLRLSGREQMELGDRLLQECRETLYGEMAQETFRVTGIMREMPEECLKFYRDAVNYDHLAPETQACFLSLYLDAEERGLLPGERRNLPMAVVCLAAGAALAVLAVVQVPACVRDAVEERRLARAYSGMIARRNDETAGDPAGPEE